MSTATEYPHPAIEPRDKPKKKKDKDKSHKKDKHDKKKSKKRRHEELDAISDVAAQDRAPSPAKRQRTDAEAEPSNVLVPDSQLPSLEKSESPFLETTASIRVSIPPVAQGYPLEGVCSNYLSPLLLTWHPQLKGIIMSYNNARLASSPPPIETSGGSKQRGESADEDEDEDEDGLGPLAQAVDEYAAPFIWVTAQFLIFRPRKGVTLEGQINLQNESHIGLILWNLFSVSIEKKCLPRSWTWHDDTEGDADDAMASANTYDKPMNGESEVWGQWYLDNGDPVEGVLRFRVTDFDAAPPSSGTEQSFLTIEGTMLSEKEEKQLEKDEAEGIRKGKEKANGRAHGRSGIPLTTAMRRTAGSTTGSMEANGVASSSREK
jgi:DNA-directed RNA polymerase I subunit RPA43